MNNFLESIIKRDPAAGNKLNVILNYPGVKAVFFHFIANKLWSLNLKIKTLLLIVEIPLIILQRKYI